MFSARKEENINLLEFGVREDGSVLLWTDYFTNAKIHGVDILDQLTIEHLKSNPHVSLSLNSDAYNSVFVTEHFTNKNLSFDIILDDGPHTLESQLDCINLYAPLLTDTGLLIIEDVASISNLNRLKNAVPEGLKRYIKTYDLRHIKNRFDDIVFTINKSC